MAASAMGGHGDLFRSTFQSSNPIGPNIIHDYKVGTGIAEHLIFGTCPQQTKMCLRTVILTMEYL